MKTLLILFLLMALNSCRQPKKPFSLLTEDIKYTTYAWYHLTGLTGPYELYVDHYININKNGHFSMMRRDSLMSKPKYYTGFINDSIANQIQRTFKQDTFKTDYKTEATKNIAYDGLVYRLDYKLEKENRKKIKFIQSDSPTEIVKLSLLFDNLDTLTKVTEVDTISLNGYLEELKKYSPPSLPPTLDSTPYKPVKIKR
jgi:hypothetical protein